MNNVQVRLIASSFLLLGVGAVSYAQDPPAQQPRPQQERERSQEEGTPAKLRGCLTKGSQAQQYVIADEESGEKIPFAVTPLMPVIRYAQPLAVGTPVSTVGSGTSSSVCGWFGSTPLADVIGSAPSATTRRAFRRTGSR